MFNHTKVEGENEFMKRNTIIALTIIGALLVVTIGATFAYFVANYQNVGIETNISVDTDSFGSILWTGTKVFTSYDFLPGQLGIQYLPVDSIQASVIPLDNSQSRHSLRFSEKVGKILVS